MLHFARSIAVRPSSGREADFAAVTSALRNLRLPRRFAVPGYRTRKLWRSSRKRIRMQSGAARMLAALRHDEGVACEQSRLADYTASFPGKAQRHDAPERRPRNLRSPSALCGRSRPDKSIYAFFVAGADLLKIAEISRVHRDSDGSLHGFQRKGIKSHVQAITDFLDQGPVLFPNAIILAIAPSARFTQSGAKSRKATPGSAKLARCGFPCQRWIEVRMDCRWPAALNRAVAGAKQKLPGSRRSLRSEELSVHRSNSF